MRARYEEGPHAGKPGEMVLNDGLELLRLICSPLGVALMKKPEQLPCGFVERHLPGVFGIQSSAPLASSTKHL